MPINFGLSAQLANLKWWNTLDPKVQAFLTTHLRKLEDSIFDQAKTETQTGLDCNTGKACSEGTPANMKLVPVTPEDEALRKDALTKVILPAFAGRCGADCVGYSAGGGGKFLYCDGCRPSVVRESMDRKNAVRRLNGTLDDEIRRDKNRRISIRRYGIEWEQYEKMLAEQGGVCAICQRPPTGRGTSGQRLHVDHDHSCCPGNRSCGKCVRALLCTNCNRGIGYFQDNPALLRVAINYLTTTNA